MSSMESLPEDDQRIVQNMVVISMKQQQLPAEDLARTNFADWRSTRSTAEDVLAMQEEWSRLVGIAMGEVEEEVKMLRFHAAQWCSHGSQDAYDEGLTMEAEALYSMVRMAWLHETIEHLQ